MLSGSLFEPVPIYYTFLILESNKSEKEEVHMQQKL